MLRYFIGLLLLVSSQAYAQQTIDQLGAGTTITGTEKLPMFQGSNPAVTTTPNALKTFIGGGGGGGPSGIGGNTASTLGSDSIVNVKNYGVVGDGQIFPDGTMASGSSTLSTKYPVTSASQSGTTVTLTVPVNQIGLYGVPGWYGGPPYFFNWKVGANVTVAGVNVSGYNGTFTITALTNTTIQYTTTAGLGAGTGGTVSVNAPFAAGDVGKLICVQGAASNGSSQKCGTISTFVDSRDVTLSFTNAYSGTISGMAFTYATSDQTAIANVFSTSVLPAGGIVYFPAGIYGLTAEIDIPSFGSWTVLGESAGGAIWNYLGLIGTGRPTSALVWLTTSMTGSSSALFFGKDATGGGYNLQMENNMAQIRDISLVGGAGWNADGGGSLIKGITTIQTNNFMIDHIDIQNFSGDCFYEATSNTGATILRSIFQNCGGYAVDIGSGQNTLIMGNLFQENANGGVAGSATVIANTIQGNGNWQVELAPASVIMGNYFEGTVYSLAVAHDPTAVFDANISHSGTPPQNVYSAAASVLTACTATYAHTRPACVSDAAACTNGNTYTPAAGAGSFACQVQCDGTNWKLNGAGCY